MTYEELKKEIDYLLELDAITRVLNYVMLKEPLNLERRQKLVNKIQAVHDRLDAIRGWKIDPKTEEEALINGN